ncbi:outer membrane beta-barrel protein [Rapidithrix thailandica]|uniref:Outer membrane beta-barrel protein n=1 Tax=Rapidithrix thailandica TaxID=413964 RepID=A0AAW9S340_9BACT
MKKLVVTFLGVLLMSSFAMAQSPLGSRGKQINFGIGLSDWGVPIYGGMDFGVHKDISVGFELSYRSHNWHHRGHSHSHSHYGIIGRGDYHFNTAFNIPQNWDLYAGLNLGVHGHGDDDHDGHDEFSGVGLGLQVGGRYYFSSKWGINLEFSGGSSVAQAKFGLSVKI